MDENKLKDLEYVAIRFVGGITYSIYKDLIENDVISNHRELCLSNINHIKSSYDKSSKTGKAFLTLANNIDKIKYTLDNYIELIGKYNIDVISCLDELYPHTWKCLSGLPLVFFTRGNKYILNNCNRKGAIGIVGTRIPSSYAVKATQEFTKQLVNHDVVIVSGGAIGIDRVAHETALCCNKDTILVAPCGLDYYYPYQNKDIYDQLYSNGLVLSEMPPGQKMLKQYFPARNRLIAALSDACLVMEAGENSGTLHTASFAASQGKEVFVLPNNIYMENSRGGLNLIRDGASILLDVDSVLDVVATSVYYRIEDSIVSKKSKVEELRDKMNETPDELTSDDWKVIICDYLSVKKMSLDDLFASIPVSYNMLVSLVSELEISGQIQSLEGKFTLTFR